jgi:hypothetical protein
VDAPGFGVGRPLEPAPGTLTVVIVPVAPGLAGQPVLISAPMNSALITA